MLNLVVLNLAPSGFAEGRKVWFRPGQSLVVGSSELADFVVACDAQMLSLHCELSCDRERCTVRSAGEGRVLVNDAPVTASTVRDGDRITIGGTTLVVQLEERVKAAAAPTPAASSAAKPCESALPVAVAGAEPSETLLTSAMDRWLS